MARQRGRSRATRLSRRWTGFTGSFLNKAIGVGALQLLTPSTILDTILRTRGHMLASVNEVQAPGQLAELAVGFIVLQEGRAVGGAVPSPLTDRNADWFWYTSFILGYEEMVTDVIDVPELSAYREVIDSKAMRLGPPDTEIAVVMESVTLSGTAMTFNVAVTGRFLLGQ